MAALVQKNSSHTGTTPFTVVLTGTTAGNAILAGGRWSTQTLSSVSDDVNGSYGTVLASKTGSDPNMFLFGIPNGAGGTITVTFTTTGGDVYGIGWVGEYTGIATSSMVDGTPDGKNGTGVTDLVSNAFSTSVANDIVVVLASQSALATYSAGTNYTLDDNAAGSALGVEERTVSGTLSSEVQHFTSNVSNGYTMLTIALKPGGGGGGGSNWGAFAAGTGMEWNRLVVPE